MVEATRRATAVVHRLDQAVTDQVVHRLDQAVTDQAVHRLDQAVTDQAVLVPVIVEDHEATAAIQATQAHDQQEEVTDHQAHLMAVRLHQVCVNALTRLLDVRHLLHRMLAQQVRQRRHLTQQARLAHATRLQLVQ